MTTIAPKLAVVLALCCVLGCSDDSDDNATQQSPSTTADAASPTKKASCDPGYVESCTTSPDKPIRRCVCLAAK
jgi:hypothetical protein